MSNFQNLLWDQMFPLIRVTGKRNRAFLHGQTTGDLLNRVTGDFVRACWLSPTGRLKAIIEISLKSEEESQLIVLAGDTKELVQGFNKVIFPSDQVEVISKDEIRRVQIISSKESWKNSLPELLPPKDPLRLQMKDLIKVSQYQLEIWRLLQGLPRSPEEINGNTNPLELGLIDLVMLNKGCYLGQETMAKLSLAGSVKQQIRFFKSDTSISIGQDLFSDPPDIDGRKVAASVTSLMKTLEGKFYGLVLVKRSYLSLEELFLEDSLNKVFIKTPISFVSI